MSGPQTFRAFIALDHPKELTAQLLATQRALQAAGIENALGAARAVWVRPEALHLTLRFLGNITGETAAQVAQAMSRAAAGSAALSLTLGEVGAFPDLRRPRVLWRGLGDEQAVRALEAALSQELGRIGLAPPEQAFHPHFTLARIKEGPVSRRSAPKKPAGRGRGGRLVSHDVTQVVHTALQQPDESGTADSEGKGGQGRAFVVYTYSLFGSHLTPHGPRYEKRAGVPLGGGKQPV